MVKQFIFLVLVHISTSRGVEVVSGVWEAGRFIMGRIECLEELNKTSSYSSKIPGGVQLKVGWASK